MTGKPNKPAVQLPAVKPLVVLPTYNEAENIVEVLDLVRAAAPEADVLVVDDGSPDGTAELADGWGRDHGGVSVLRRAEKQGLGSAYRAGFAQGLERGYGILIEMDSDLQHDPAMLPALIHAVQDGADLAIGSRYVPGGAVPGWKLSRRAISQGGNIYAAMVLGMKVRDATAGFRAYSADALTRIDLTRVKADGYGFQIEMAYTVDRNGGRIVEVPITFADRVRGTSKMSTRIVAEALLLVTWWGFRDRVARPLRRAVRGTPKVNR
jgi:dolichol-phosphate mannosyltransferase